MFRAGVRTPSSLAREKEREMGGGRERVGKREGEREM
jgi:hypothetical protein